MVERVHISKISSITGQKIFVDTNIWLLLEGPFPDFQDHRVRSYSRAFKDILSSNNTIVVDNNVISEFANRYAKIHFEAQKADEKTTLKFKEFRNSDDFKIIAGDIRDTVLYIAEENEFNVLDKNDYNFNAIFDEFLTGDLDYNDILIKNICLSNGYYLLTDDRDYKGSKINLISGNPRVLS